MEFEWDEAKRDRNLEKHHIDFADAAELFRSSRFEWRDARHDYGEQRCVTIGVIAGRVCVCAYTLRESRYRSMSLRRAKAREQARYWQTIAEQWGRRG
ncbi:MAG: BrnT family toxin [Sulfobacillus benefaciens]|uniref:BrnT family toxin n=1 Tax=Sulfobacillus benefaciens TaxID=453960 RepID=A0A2T2XCW6_9FIRM|nr:MAG: BrnT family toxin [Sulfobacillus benefaciens]